MLAAKNGVQLLKEKAYCQEHLPIMYREMQMVRILVVCTFLCLVYSVQSMSQQPHSFESLLNNAPVVVEGRVVKLELRPRTGKVTIVISKRYRGEIGDTIIVEWVWRSRVNNKYFQEVGNSYLLFLPGGSAYSTYSFYDDDDYDRITYWEIGKFLPSEFIVQDYRRYKKTIDKEFKEKGYIAAIRGFVIVEESNEKKPDIFPHVTSLTIDNKSDLGSPLLTEVYRGRTYEVFPMQILGDYINNHIRK